MQILSWNIQGLKKAQAISEAKFLIKSKKPDFFFIETMLSDTNSRKILPQLGFDHFEFIFSVNDSGGLAFL